MEVLFNWKTNSILREVRDDVYAEGYKKGYEEGFKEGLRIGLRVSLRSFLGKVPQWTELRIDRASPKQILAWISKVPRASRIEDVIRPLKQVQKRPASLRRKRLRPAPSSV